MLDSEANAELRNLDAAFQRQYWVIIDAARVLAAPNLGLDERCPSWTFGQPGEYPYPACRPPQVHFRPDRNVTGEPVRLILLAVSKLGATQAVLGNS